MDTKDFLQPIQGGEQQTTADPIIEERIKEEIDSVLEKIRVYEGYIKEWEEQLQKHTIYQKLRNQDPNTEIKKNIKGWRLEIASLQASINRVPEAVVGQIANNRRSEHRYHVDYFFDHSIKVGNNGMLADLYPYDPILGYHRDPHKVDENDRTYRNSHQASERLRPAFNGNKSLTLYDTTNPHLQMRHESLIDLLVILGFARNDEGMRSIDAVKADTGIDHHALDKYDGPLLRPACSLIQEPTLYRVGDGVASSLVIEGNRDYNPRSPAAEARPGVNTALSQLCKEWDISALVGSLTYTRTSKDTIITVQLAKPEDIIEAGPVTRLPVV